MSAVQVPSAYHDSGEEIYRRLLPSLMQQEENIGKIVAIDLETGDYAIGDDLIPAVKALKRTSPEAIPTARRIGYNAVYAIGGSVVRVDSNGKEIGE